MCIRFDGWKPVVEFADAATIRRRLALLAWAVVLVCIGVFIGWWAREGRQNRLAPQDVKASLAWLRAKMPNTPFTSAAVDPDAPWLMQVKVGKGQVPVVYDPAHHAVLLGVVVNFDDPAAKIAPGVAAR